MKVYRTYFPYAHLIGQQASPGLEKGITTSERKRGLWFSLVFFKEGRCMELKIARTKKKKLE